MAALSSPSETLYAPIVELVQDIFGTSLATLDAFFPFTSVALILFLVLLSTSIFDMTQKEFWIDAKLILLKNVFKLICVGLFMTGYLTLTMIMLIVWFVVDKYMDYSFLHKCEICKTSESLQAEIELRETDKKKSYGRRSTDVKVKLV